MTKEQRVECYTAVLDRLYALGTHEFFICVYLHKYAVSKGYVDRKADIQGNFPEFMKQQPKGKTLTAPWWPDDFTGLVAREKALKAAIHDASTAA